MLATSYSDVRKNFKEFCDRATDDGETIIVTRREGKNVVIISLDQYNKLMESLEILKKSKLL